MKFVAALCVTLLSTTLCAVAEPAPAPSADPSAGGEPDVQFHADVRAKSLQYQIVPRHAGGSVHGVNFHGRATTATNVASPKPRTLYRNVRAVFDASGRFVDPHAAASSVPKPRATR